MYQRRKDVGGAHVTAVPFETQQRTLIWFVGHFCQTSQDFRSGQWYDPYCTVCLVTVCFAGSWFESWMK